MPKYSTNSDANNSDEEGEAATNATMCELCGTESDDLKKARVERALLAVCSSCSPLDDSASQDDGQRDEQETDRTKDVIQKATQHGYQPDNSWVEETQYTSNQTPYLVNGYAEKIVETREEAEMSQGELADKAMVGLKALRHIESGNAVRADAGRDELGRIEDVLGIEIIEDV